MIRKLAHNFLSRGLVALVNFYILLLSSRYLGVESRGEIGIFLLNIAVMQLLAEVYTGYSLIHFLPHSSFYKILRDGIFTIAFVTFSGNIFTSFLGRQITSTFTESWLSTLLVLSHTFFMILLLGLQKFRIFNLLSVLQPLLLAVLLSLQIFLKKDFTFSAYYSALTLSFFIAIIFSFVFLFTVKKNTIQDYDFKKITKGGFQFQLSLLMFYFMNRYNYYILPDKRSVGMYNVACTIMESVLLLSYAAGSVGLSVFSNSKNNSHQHTFFSLGRICFFLSAAGAFILSLVPDEWMQALLGTAYGGISGLMRLYAPVIPLQALMIIFSNYMASQGKQNMIWKSWLPGFAIVVIGSPLAISFVGITAAPVIVVIACLLAIIISSRFISGLTGSNAIEILNISRLEKDFRNLLVNELH